MNISFDDIAVNEHSDRESGTLYLHYPCFDGLVSASIAWDFVATSKNWTIANLCRVNYDRLGGWLQTRLAPNSVVVDFLYHPDATFWADHHGTTFITEESRRDFEIHKRGRLLLYDRDSPSCAMMLWNKLRSGLSDEARYGEMAVWADKIDSANYASVDEAIYGSHPALEISLSLAVAGEQEYFELLLHSMRTMTLANVASLAPVRSRVTDAKQRVENGLQSVRDGIHMEPGEIAVFEAKQTQHGMVSRYSPYVFFPNARYSVAMVSSANGAKITAMRNPWRDFESVELGSIFENYGGGGHRRVASAVVPNDKAPNPTKALKDIIAEIRAQDTAKHAAQIRRSA